VTTSQIIHEWLMARAMLAHQRSDMRRVPWEALDPDERERFMSAARCYVEPSCARARSSLERVGA
jgi:hypothetical protein